MKQNWKFQLFAKSNIFYCFMAKKDFSTKRFKFHESKEFQIEKRFIAMKIENYPSTEISWYLQKMNTKNHLMVSISIMKAPNSHSVERNMNKQWANEKEYTFTPFIVEIEKN